MSQGYNNTIGAVEVCKLCIGVCDALEDDPCVTKLSPMMCTASGVTQFMCQSRNEVRSQPGYFLGPQQPQPFLLGVGCQTVLLL